MSKTLVVIAFLVAGLVLMIGIYFNHRAELTLYKNVISLNNYDTSDLDDASRYYDQASLAYELQDYKMVESNCRTARDYYSKYTQTLREEKVRVSGIEGVLFDKYKGMLEEQIIICNSLYEACEHFESASRYYDLYFNTEVSVDDISFDMGGQEIESMNEKITIHDEAVERYNNLLAEYQAEVKRLI